MAFAAVDSPPSLILTAVSLTTWLSFSGPHICPHRPAEGLLNEFTQMKALGHRVRKLGRAALVLTLLGEVGGELDQSSTCELLVCSNFSAVLAPQQTLDGFVKVHRDARGLCAGGFAATGHGSKPG